MLSRKELYEIERILKESELFLKERFKIKEISIFGLWVRGEERERSDVDILIEFCEVISLLDFVALGIFKKEGKARGTKYKMKQP